MARSNKKMRDIVIVPPSCSEQYLPIQGSLQQLGVRSAGYSKVFAPYKLAYRDPDFHIVFFTISGSGFFETENVRGTFRPGEVFYTPAHHWHRYWTDSEFQMFWFRLYDVEHWSFMRESLAEQRSAKWFAPLLYCVQQYLVESISSVPDAAQVGDLYGDLIGMYLTRELMTAESPSDQAVRQRLDRLRLQIHENLGRAWHVDDIAKSLHVSHVHLNRIVAKYLDTTPIGMVRDLRMRRAKELLLHTSLPLKTIADLVGYDTPYSLSKAFSKHTGQSPRAFRKHTQRHPPLGQSCAAEE